MVRHIIGLVNVLFMIYLSSPEGDITLSYTSNIFSLKDVRNCNG